MWTEETVIVIKCLLLLLHSCFQSLTTTFSMYYVCKGKDNNFLLSHTLTTQFVAMVVCDSLKEFQKRL